MNIAVISYSLTGNNEALASNIASIYDATHIKIKESKARLMGSIIFDLLANRTPKVNPMPDELRNYDLLVLVAPVWIGSAATPLRAYLDYIKQNHCRYAYVSISGGADNKNPKLPEDLAKRTGKKPAALIDLHITDLLPQNPKSQRKDTSAYRITAEDVKKLTVMVSNNLKDIIH